MTPDYARVEGEWILGALRERIPEAIQPFWRYGLTFLLAAIGASFIVLGPETPLDGARAFNLACASYIIPLSVQIARTNWYYRRALEPDLERAGRFIAVREALRLVQGVPGHITALAFGVACYNVAFSLGYLFAFGDPAPFTPSAFIVGLGNISIIAGLNFIWRFVLTRRNAQEGAGRGRA